MGSGAVRTALVVAGRVANDVLSFVVFTLLDMVDVLLCFFYKLADYALEAQWKPCYCSSSPGGIISGSGKIFVLSMISSTKLHLEDISDTLYSRPSFLSETSKTVLDELRRRKLIRWRRSTPPSSVTAATTVTVNSTIIHMLQGKIGSKKSHPVRSWSDCPCDSCSPSGSRDTLFVHAECPKDGGIAEEDVLFIHGFISSSAFWTETVFPNFGDEARARYRLFAVDLLGFGKSPKPVDSLYTLREHVETIEKSVLERYNVKSFHLVAHSLGSLLALALAVKHPGGVKSLTILAPVTQPTSLLAIFHHVICHLVLWCSLVDNRASAAVLPGAEGGAGDAIRPSAGGAATGVATDHIRLVGDLLVRAHQPNGVPHPVQAPPPVGARLQVRNT
ncbi:hypothetical protein BHM03_00038763 [Ensete ventricosum]|nr:hypothetical protein BHM03_00038763 [Ensete ventricosum]